MRDIQIKLNDTELHSKVKSIFVEEMRITQEGIRHIAEVDRRKLYAKMGYSSLYAYLREAIGYSEGAAQRRIDAARLSHQIPNVLEKIGGGTLHLSQISKVQKICRQIRKDSGQKVSAAQQRQVLQKIEKKGAAQTDLILAQEFQVEVKVVEKKQIQRDESVRIEMTFSKEEMEILQKAREILSNQTGGNLKDTIVAMAQKIVKSAEPKTTATVATAPVTKTITPRIKKEIRFRDQFCQFKDPKTHKICGSKYFLEVDHIKPRFAAGGNETHNLRMLCRTHNIYRYNAGV